MQMQPRRFLVLLLLTAVASPLLKITIAAPVPDPSISASAARSGLTPKLRRCLARLDVRLIDGSDPAVLKAAAGGRLWAAIHSRAVPLAVVFPRSAAAVAGVVRCAQRAGVKITARSGGGSFMGYSVRSGTLTLDLSELDGVTVAKDKRSVTVQGGVRLGQLYYQVFKQGGSRVAAVAGTCPNVGVGGHLLGGGYSYLTPLHGLACDQLLSITVVDANGDLITANKQENKDLFAASCGGGGGNFGIATEFRLRLHSHFNLFTLTKFVIDKQHAIDFLMHWQRQVLPHASSKLFCELKMQAKGVVSVTMFMPGSKRALDAELLRLGILKSAWLRDAQLPLTSISELSWIESMVEAAGSKAKNRSLEALLDFGYMLAGRNVGFAEKSWYALRPLPRRAFSAISKALKDTNSNMVLYTSGLKTAVRRRAQRDTAFPWRKALYFLKAVKRVNSANDVRLLPPAMKRIQEVMATFIPDQPAVLNYIDAGVSSDPLWSYYGPNLRWLQQVKAKYDATNYFNTNPIAIPAAATTRQGNSLTPSKI